jgi:hypothetical protein
MAGWSIVNSQQSIINCEFYDGRAIGFWRVPEKVNSYSPFTIDDLILPKSHPSLEAISLPNPW